MALESIDTVRMRFLCCTCMSYSLPVSPVQDAEKYRSEDEEARKKIEAKNAVENYACALHASVPPVMDASHLL